MEKCLDQSRIEFQQNNSTDMSDFQEGEFIDLTKLLDKIEEIDDLDTLDDIENMLLLENEKKAEDLNRKYHQIAELKDELNRAKCELNELDKLHSDEQEKIEKLRETTQLKQLEMLQEKNQQVEDLDQFELEVADITKKCATAPKEYEVSRLNEKIYNWKEVLDEKEGLLLQQIREVTRAQEEFKEPIEMESMDLPMKIFDDTITEIMSSNKKLAQSMDKMSKQINKLHFSMGTSNIWQGLGFKK